MVVGTFNLQFLSSGRGQSSYLLLSAACMLVAVALKSRGGCEHASLGFCFQGR